MSAPRQVLPGRTYLLSRRCSQRQFLLRPSRAMNALFLYCLAYAAEKFGILVHVYTVMSNHYHLVVTDPDGVIPDFMHCLNLLVARAGNSLLGRFEGFWGSGTYSCVALEDDAAIIDKIVYTLTNPVAAGLVAYGHAWPGLRTRTSQIGVATVEAKRPGVFFRDGMPASVKLKLTLPPLSGGQTPDEIRTLIRELVAERETRLRQEKARKKEPFLGRAAVQQQSPFESPRGFAPRFRLKPRVAVKDRWRRMEVLQRLKGFLEAYQDARERYRAGERQVVFPYGTWLMRVQQGVVCAAPP